MTTLSPAELDTLVDIAERSVRRAVLQGGSLHPEPAEYPPALRAPGAVFVSLHRHGTLRGCIGTLAAVAPLVDAVADRARAAALTDPRFTAVRPDELSDLQVSISVLSAPEPIEVDSYDALVAALRPGVDGLIVESGRHRATFLPVVWEELPAGEAFVAHLWRKAGLPPRSWPRGTTALRYVAQHAAAAERAKLHDA
ncbi:MAG: AmmeMemoRadiSam system protein A [Actinomycetota bacterium]|nr:AmmeMemoRadiSam system protein A [Actinomycetota bacterium]